MAWTIQTLPVLFVLWLVLDGAGSWPVGLLAAVLAALALGWLAEGPLFRLAPGPLLAFAAFFLIESLRGGTDVAWRTLHPRLPIAPDFFDYSIDLPRGPATTLLISTISLLPGTLSAELKRDEHRLVVHSLSGGGHESVARLERRIAVLFRADGGGR
ncbi:MAG: Na+/H+ antiporter subunit E [Wenzhouxiangellaceae bacterium]|nr:Na+/H+ antiporter subunit E [Wenzhouxiangellaceae bacterium]